jgi:hypothetical protein
MATVEMTWMRTREILRGHNVIRLGVRGRVGVRITTSDPHIGDFPSTDYIIC